MNMDGGMMFIRKKTIEGMKADIKYLNSACERLNNKIYKIEGDHQCLLDALGLVRQETHIVEYVKKGGPERGMR